MKTKLTKREKAIEKALIRGEFQRVDKKKFEAIRQAISRRKKDAVLNIRVNSEDLKNLKLKAKRMGIPYQTFITELLHQFAG